ncbi:MAG: hypothetical protein AVDCRST_MAG39-228, partial [uncultured Sphingomonadaceae bacterium]
ERPPANLPRARRRARAPARPRPGRRRRAAPCAGGRAV